MIDTVNYVDSLIYIKVIRFNIQHAIYSEIRNDTERKSLQLIIGISKIMLRFRSNVGK